MPSRCRIGEQCVELIDIAAVVFSIVIVKGLFRHVRGEALFTERESHQLDGHFDFVPLEGEAWGRRNPSIHRPVFRVWASCPILTTNGVPGFLPRWLGMRALSGILLTHSF